MEFDNTFDVPLPPDAAWALLMDIERIAPCLPGAKLTEVVDSKTYRGEVSVRLGPVSLTFKGETKFEEVDPALRTARVKAEGKDAKGRGGANAMVDFRVEPAGAHSTVTIHTDLMLFGPVAQYGRGVGMVQDLAAQLIDQFADNLKAQLDERPDAAADEAPPEAAKPVSGLSLLAKVLWNAILRMFTGRKNAP